MTEVRIGDEEGPVFLQQSRYLRELLKLETAEILEHALHNNDVETLATELDRILREIDLAQIWRGLMDSDVDSVIPDVAPEQPHQCGRPAAYVEQVAVPLAGDVVDDPRGLPQPVVRGDVLA